MDKDKLKSPMERRDFLRRCGALVAGGVALATGGLLATKANGKTGEVFWQIDPYRCTQCQSNNNALVDEATTALVMLGFSKAAIAKVMPALLKDNPNPRVEDLIKAALKKL